MVASGADGINIDELREKLEQPGEAALHYNELQLSQGVDVPAMFGLPKIIT